MWILKTSWVISFSLLHTHNCHTTIGNSSFSELCKLAFWAVVGVLFQFAQKMMSDRTFTAARRSSTLRRLAISPEIDAVSIKLVQSLKNQSDSDISSWLLKFRPVGLQMSRGPLLPSEKVQLQRAYFFIQFLFSVLRPSAVESTIPPSVLWAVHTILSSSLRIFSINIRQRWGTIDSTKDSISSQFR